MTFFVNQIPTKHITEKCITSIDYFFTPFPHNNDLPALYCHKYDYYISLAEKYQKDSDGDLINIAVDDINAVHFPEFVASSNIVTPKYLVYAKPMQIKLVGALIVVALNLLLANVLNYKLKIFFLFRPKNSFKLRITLIFI